jgi:holo-[acyl-carrier protein] synthase
MILGLGSDLCNIERIEKSMARFGQKFLDRIFTAHEQAKAERRPLLRAATYAKRFAAKEACAKALGTGIRRGVFWRTMEVINLPSGQPTLRLSGGAAARLTEMVPEGMVADIHLSLTDDMPWAQAIVMISARPGVHSIR